jgi:hypothetical protein
MISQGLMEAERCASGAAGSEREGRAGAVRSCCKIQGSYKNNHLGQHMSISGTSLIRHGLNAKARSYAGLRANGHVET